jgi:multimeric flavodoxin WrbA
MKEIRIVGVVSSANREGSSATLVREALRGAASAGAATSEIFLPDYNLGFCKGCLQCNRLGRCPQPDDFERVRDMLRAATGMVLSSPTYGAAPCALMKNLIDRLGLFEYMTSSVFGGKYIATIATAKSFGADRTAQYLASIPLGTLFKRAYLSGTLAAVLSKGITASESPKHLRQAQALGVRLAEDCRMGRTYPFQDVVARLNRFLMRPLIAKGIVQHRQTDMHGVYENLATRGLLS